MPKDDFRGAGILEENPGALFLRPDAAAVLIWEALARASRARESPWRTPVLATVSADGAPQARMLVLRAADSRARRLELHSDSRSAKFHSIAGNPLVELCFWHPAAGLQLRAAGEGRVETSLARRESAWARVPDESRRNYRTESAPGAILPGPDANRAADGFANFAILDVEVSRLEWLWLGGVRHERGRAAWDGRRWGVELLVP